MITPIMPVKPTKPMKPIKAKVLAIILSISLCALLLLGASCLAGILNMRGTLRQSSGQLGETAAETSGQALKDKAQQEMLTLATSRAQLADEKLFAIQHQTKQVASLAGRIYSNKQDYPARTLDYLQPEDVGKYSVHIRTAPGVSQGDVRDELNYAANIADALALVLVDDIGISASYIGTETGLMITADKNSMGPNRKDYDATQRGWYQGAKREGGVYWTDLFADSSGRGASISCAVPFYEESGGQKTLRGVAGSGAVLENINAIIQATRIGEGGYAFLLDGKGQVVITPKAEGVTADANGNLIGEDYLHSADPDVGALALAMTGRESGIRELSLSGQRVYVAYHPLVLVDWSLAVVLPVSEVLRPSDALHEQILSLNADTMASMDRTVWFTGIMILAVAALTITLTVLFSLWFSGKLTKPIQKLAGAAREISTGNLDVELRIQTGDEVQQLGDAFSDMAHRLKDYIRDLARTTAEKERLDTELGVAKQIQESVLPRIFPPFPNYPDFDLFALMNPAKEVGGDFYDFFFVDESHLAIVIADVSGKGIPAALFMMVARTLIKNSAVTGIAPGEVFTGVNALLCEGNETSMFVTAFMAVIDLASGEVRFVNAGHNPPVLIRRGGEASFIRGKTGFVLAGMPGLKYVTESLTIEPGDKLLLYTDGVTEAFNKEEQLFSDKRLIDLLNALPEGIRTPRELLRYVRAQVDAFANGAEQADDITMLSFDWTGQV